MATVKAKASHGHQRKVGSDALDGGQWQACCPLPSAIL
jgi:hypothetical protein